jgi:hypothetical protein
MKRLLFALICLSSVSRALEYEGQPSGNFIIRWAFQELCDHVYDHRNVWPTPTKDGRPVHFKASAVKPGDMIFVRDCQSFFEEKHPRIKVPYFVLTHGEYLDKFKEKYVKYLKDDKILAWFTIHPCDMPDHERIIPIPLGIVQQDNLYKRRTQVHKKFMNLRKGPKKKMVYMNFTEWHMPFRTKIKNYFKDEPFVTHRERCEFNEFISELGKHKFVLSPPGLGPDCYRVWESLLVGTIPIVQHSHMDEMYEGLPVLFIDDWKEVTEKFLNKKYKEITSKTYSQEKLYMEYWIDVITKTRQKFWPR